jgi:hypothetical protein
VRPGWIHRQKITDASQSIQRIYTEDKNKRDILRLASKRFESFTVQPTLVITADGRGARLCWK